MGILQNKIISTFSGKTCTVFGLGIILFPLFFGSITLLPNTRLAFGLNSVTQVLLGGILLTLSYFEKSKFSKDASITASLLLTIFYLLSDLPIRSNSYLGEYFPFHLYLLIASIIYLLYSKVAKPLTYLLSIACILTGVIALYLTTNGNLIFTDDHPCFLYRLMQLRNHFPNIPFYNPEWNAGVEAREFFASGVLNVFFIFSPLLYFIEIENIYTLIVILILFGLLPFSLFLAGRNFKMSLLEISILICLGLTHSIYWYRWSLSYGTMGFIVSMALVPLNLSFIRNLIDEKNKILKTTIVTMSLIISLMLLWSLSVLLLISVSLLSLCFLQNSINRKAALITLILVTALNLPWATIFYKASNVGDFVFGGASQSQQTSMSNFDSSKFKVNSKRIQEKSINQHIIYNIRKNMLPVSPLIIFFSIPGLYFYKEKRTRALLIAFCLGAAVLGFFISIIKPHLELDRMILPMSLILSFPTASLLASSLVNNKNRLTNSLLITLLLYSPFWVYKVSSNNSSEIYSVQDPTVKNLANNIKINASGGRTLFAGFSLHELSGGHLAPLAKWANTPLIASSFQHDKWKYVDVIPEIYRKEKEKGVMEFLDLYNVSLVVSHDKFWRNWFNARPQFFTEIWKEGKFTVFKLNHFKSNYFMEGEGTILRQENGEVALQISSKTAVIKFSYLPFLKSSNCQISNKRIKGNINFISLSNCSNQKEVIISSKDSFERFF